MRKSSRFTTAADTLDIEDIIREANGFDAPGATRNAFFAANDVTPVTGRRVQPMRRAA